MSSIYLRGGVWQIQFQKEGKTVQKSLKTKSKGEALAIQRDLNRALFQRQFFPGHSGGSTEKISDLVRAFENHALTYYRDKAGNQTSTMNRVTVVLAALRTMSDMDVDSFRPSTLRKVRDAWVAEGKVRSTVNQYHSMLVLIFRWGVGQEIVRPDTVTALDAVEMLVAGRSDVKDTERIMPVPEADLEAVRAIAPPLVRDMIDLQVLTAARPGELRLLKVSDVNRTGEVWTATLAHHKTAHKGKARTLFFGPQAQTILAPHLEGRVGEVFPSASSKNWFTLTIAALCKEAGVKSWTPNQLRHLAATRVRAALNAETASVLLGHSSLSTTEIYAEKNEAVARAAALTLG